MKFTKKLTNTFLTKTIKQSLQYKGFTLAEVLITLGIIGIVAAITIPALMKDTQNKENITALKSFYSDISSATITIRDQNGGTLKQLGQLSDAYANLMQVTKTCAAGAVQGVCWHTNAVDWYMLNGNVTGVGSSLGPGFILNNGMLVSIPTFYPNCNGDSAGMGVVNNNGCGWIIVDVNGFKNPNTIGKDIFYFQVLIDKIEPMGGINSNSFAIDCTNSGLGCTAKYF